MADVELPCLMVRDIVARASTLWERLGDDRYPVSAQSASVGRGRAARWASVLALRDANKLYEFATQRGISREQLACRLAGVTLCADARLPPWGIVLGRIATTTAAGDFGSTVHDAVGTIVGIAESMLQENIVETCGFPLSRELRQNFSLTLAKWLNASLSAGCACFHFDLSQQTESHGRAFDVFTLFNSLPMVARLVATALSNWVDTLSEFSGRLGCDVELLRSTFGDGYRLCLIRSMQFASDDPHEGGRRVIRIDFEGSPSLFYKPRPMGPDVAIGLVFNKLKRLNAVAGSLPVSLERGEYGWSQEVVGAGQERQSPDFWRNAGRFLCIAHISGMRDLHNENLINQVDAPIAVDLESVCVGEVNLDSICSTEAELKVMRTWMSSAPTTGLLPRWHPDGNDIKCGFSLPEDHIKRTQCVADLLNGYAECYRLLIAGKNEFFFAANGQTEFCDKGVRIVLRDTGRYAAIMSGLTSPSALRDGFEFGLVLESLNQHDFHPVALGIHRAEIAAMTNLDIPRFMAQANGRHLLTGTLVVPNFFARSGNDALCSRLDSLGETKLAEQCEIIRGVIGTRFGMFPERRAAKSETDEFRNLDCRGIAMAIADNLKNTAFRGSDNSVSWLTPCRVGASQKFIYSQIDLSLSSGLAGVAVFFSAICRAIQRHEDQSFLESLLHTIKARLAHECAHVGNDRLSAQRTDLASILYPLAVAATMTPEACDIKQTVTQLVSLAKLIRVDRNTCPGLCRGLAGVISGLLLWGERFHITHAVDTARRLSLEWLRCCQKIPDVSDSYSANCVIDGLTASKLAIERVMKVTSDPAFTIEYRRKFGVFISDYDKTPGSFKPKSEAMNGPEEYRQELFDIENAAPTEQVIKSMLNLWVAIHDDDAESAKFRSEIPLRLIAGFCFGSSGLGYQLLRIASTAPLPKVFTGDVA